LRVFIIIQEFEMKKLLLTVTIASLIGCVSLQSPKLTPEQIGWMRKVMKEELTFTVPADQIEQAWSRVFKFISNYCYTKIQAASDYHVETYDAPVGPGSLKYVYGATKVKVGVNYELSVNGHCSMMPYDDGWLSENLHVMAHYVRTGDLEYPMLVDGRENHLHVSNVREQYAEAE
jgi:hypothetical protein